MTFLYYNFEVLSSRNLETLHKITFTKSYNVYIRNFVSINTFYSQINLARSLGAILVYMSQDGGKLRKSLHFPNSHSINSKTETAPIFSSSFSMLKFRLQKTNYLQNARNPNWRCENANCWQIYCSLEKRISIMHQP